MALTRSTDPLVWIDCEMTGLDPERDTIMSVACVLTTADLQALDVQGFSAVVHHTTQQLAKMSPWCVQTHGATGLTGQCLASTQSAEMVAADLLAYIQRHIPEPGRALLAGNSIHADRSFLVRAPWDGVVKHLHYRLFDVSSTKEMLRRWAPLAVLDGCPPKQLRHTAVEDILESLEEARYYKSLIERLTDTSQPLPAAPYAGVNLGTSIDVPVSLLQTVAGRPRPPTLGTKQGQEALDMLLNNGTRDGDIGNLDPGYRTDVA